MKGKLIVLEGLSAAGKNTQVKLLVKHLRKKHATTYMTFPDYSSAYGKLIALYLAGKLGRKEDLVELACLLYALDRYAHKKKILSLLKKGTWVVLDRYSPSNYAFQGALVKNRNALWKWIDSLEGCLPKPDKIIFLDVPRTQTSKLYSGRKQKNKLTKRDIHETDSTFENRVYANYKLLAKRKGWKTVKCVKNGKLLPAGEIHGKVLKAVKANK
ncbi:dTMP kinase [Candidatus Micrarchaeota archaeon]|nr:dTMP kinase [Candidatus Micrarchaeota archaeon]